MIGTKFDNNSDHSLKYAINIVIFVRFTCIAKFGFKFVSAAFRVFNDGQSSNIIKSSVCGPAFVQTRKCSNFDVFELEKIYSTDNLTDSVVYI